MVSIRRVKQGDENSLAYIQTESWKAAFKDIVPADKLERCTEIDRATAMYKGLLEENKGYGYILEIDGKPHCIAYWDASREKDLPGYAELICIHSLQDKWHQGYGSMMMEKVLADVAAAGFSKIMLWVFDQNTRAINFYKKHGFAETDRKQPALGAVEVMLEKNVSALRKINTEDAYAQWQYTTNLPEDENGLTNPYHGISYDEYVNTVLAKMEVID